MKDNGIVKGHKSQAVPLIVSVDTVYVHTDIKKVEPPTELSESTMVEFYNDLYEYHEIQYTLQEYTELIGKDLEKEKKKSTELSQTSDSVLLALAEQFENFNKAQNEILLALAEVYETVQSNHANENNSNSGTGQN